VGDQWDLVGGNPAPGDPTWVGQQAKTLQAIGEDASDCSTQLQAIHDKWSASDWSGQAADLFAARLGAGIVPDLSRLQRSYAIASGALGSFASTAQGLQSSAAVALSQAEQAMNDRQSADANLSSASAQHSAAYVAISSADRRISEFQSGIDGQLVAAGVDMGTRRVVSDLLATLAASGSSATGAVASQVVSRLQASPGATSLQSFVHESVVALGDAAQSRIDEQAAADRASEAMTVARNASEDASGRLAAAQATIDEIRTDFQRAAGVAGTLLEEATAAGLPNVSAFDRFVARAQTDIADGLRATDRVINDLDAAYHGNFSGLEEDAKEAAILDLKVEHLTAQIMHETASVVATVTQYAAPALLIVALVVSIVGFPEVGLGFLALSKTASLIGTAASEEELADDAVEDASDVGLQALGAGDPHQMKHDLTQTEQDVIPATVGALAGLVFPDVGDVVQGQIEGIDQGAVRIVESNVSPIVQQVATGRVEDALGVPSH
jgi:hypothetical protein